MELVDLFIIPSIFGVGVCLVLLLSRIVRGVSAEQETDRHKFRKKPAFARQHPSN